MLPELAGDCQPGRPASSISDGGVPHRGSHDSAAEDRDAHSCHPLPAGRLVIDGQVPLLDLVPARAGHRGQPCAGASPSPRLRCAGIGDRLVPRPAPLVIGDHPPSQVTLTRSRSAGTSTRRPITAGSDRVVAAVEAHVMVARQPDVLCHPAPARPAAAPPSPPGPRRSGRPAAPQHAACHRRVRLAASTRPAGR